MVIIKILATCRSSHKLIISQAPTRGGPEAEARGEKVYWGLEEPGFAALRAIEFGPWLSAVVTGSLSLMLGLGLGLVSSHLCGCVCPPPGT